MVAVGGQEAQEIGQVCGVSAPSGLVMNTPGHMNKNRDPRVSECSADV